MTKTLLIIYTVFYLLRFFFHWTLSIMNMNEVIKAKELPLFAQGWFKEEGYEKSRSYSLRKGNFGLVQFAFQSVLIIGLIYWGFPGHLDKALGTIIPQGIFRSISYLFIFSAILDLLSTPFEVYTQFIIEAEFDFNKMTGKTWLTDKLKGLILSLILGVPLLAFLFYFMENTGPLWWVYGWAGLTFFQLVISLLYPLIIAPLFNKFTPLDEGELKESLENLSKQCGFKTKGIFIMDGSKRSSHSNAYFTGLGRSKRIVLFDTLVEKLTVEELTAVMAHEIGHFKKKHILKRLITSFASSAALFFLLSLALEWLPLFEAFSFSETSGHALLVILMYFSSPLVYFITPLSSFFSRKHEYQADNYAAEAVGSGKSLQNALIKLNRDNLSNLTPHPVYSSFYYSHPPLKERWENLNKDE